MGQREIQGELVLKVAPVFKDPEENLENLACLGSQGKWVHLEKMEVMERKEDPVFPVLLVLLDSQDECKHRKRSWAKTIFKVETQKPTRLPIVDVQIEDFGKPYQAFELEIGEVCFS